MRKSEATKNGKIKVGKWKGESVYTDPKGNFYVEKDNYYSVEMNDKEAQEFVSRKFKS